MKEHGYYFSMWNMRERVSGLVLGKDPFSTFSGLVSSWIGHLELSFSFVCLRCLLKRTVGDTILVDTWIWSLEIGEPLRLEITDLGEHR